MKGHCWRHRDDEPIAADAQQMGRCRRCSHDGSLNRARAYRIGLFGRDRQRSCDFLRQKGGLLQAEEAESCFSRATSGCSLRSHSPAVGDSPRLQCISAEKRASRTKTLAWRQQLREAQKHSQREGAVSQRRSGPWSPIARPREKNER